MTTLEELVPVILDKTRQGKIQWEEAGQHVYIANLSDAVLRIEFDQNSRTVDHRLTLLDSIGNAIEAYAPLRETEADVVLSGLYDLARRKALKVDEALDGLKKTLSSL